MRDITDKQREVLDRIGKNKEDIVWKEFNNGKRKKAIWKKCQWCEEKFKVALTNFYGKRGPKFCSSSCAMKYRHNKESDLSKMSDAQKEVLNQLNLSKEEIVWTKKGNKRVRGIKRKCNRCQEMFEAPLTDVVNDGGKFCSRECANQREVNRELTDLTNRQTKVLDKYDKTLEDVFWKESNQQNVKAIEVKCKNCGKTIKRSLNTLSKTQNPFCSQKCVNKYNSFVNRKDKIYKAVSDPVGWGQDIAYLTGLVASDGNVRPNKPIIRISSKDKEITKNFKEIAKTIEPNSNATIHTYGSETGLFHYAFSSRRYKFFLNKIGVYPNKSLTIGKLDIPDKYFAHFLRGEIDGDGCLCDNIVNGYEHKSLSMTSASEKYVRWLRDKISQNTKLFKPKISRKHGKNEYYSIAYCGSSAIKLGKYIYKNANYSLSRKKNIFKGWL